MFNDSERARPSIGQLRSLEGFKRAHVRGICEACGGDIERAANLLDLTPGEVARWLEESRCVPDGEVTDESEAKK